MEYYSGFPPTLTTYLSTTEIICETGYRFQDLAMVQTINCTALGTWSEIPPCDSISNFLRERILMKEKLERTY